MEQMFIFEWVLVPRKYHVYTISSSHYQVGAKRELLRMCWTEQKAYCVWMLLVIGLLPELT